MASGLAPSFGMTLPGWNKPVSCILNPLADASFSRLSPFAVFPSWSRLPRRRFILFAPQIALPDIISMVLSGGV